MGIAATFAITMEKEKNSSQVGGLIFAGCMFIGMGIGWAMGRMVPGMFIGMGVGLVAMGIVILGRRGKE